MSDMLNITDAQARVLRAISYYESESGEKGATQYTCSKKVPIKFHVSGSTFNDNIKELAKNLMVFRLKRKKDSQKKTKPYTITDIGQIAWLMYFDFSENIEIIQKIFPNIQLSAVDEIVNVIQSPLMKKVKNKYSLGVLRIALNSFHIEDVLFPKKDAKFMVKETIELIEHGPLIKTSFSRYYNAIQYSLSENLKEQAEIDNIPNFNELEISIVDRITFLFYYNLIQSFISFGHTMDVIIIGISKRELNIEDKYQLTLKNKKKIPYAHEDMKDLYLKIKKKKNEIMKAISSNETITKIIRDNLKNVKEYKSKDNDFQNISQIFFKK